MAQHRLYDVTIADAFQMRAPLAVIGDMYDLQRPALERIATENAAGEPCTIHFSRGRRAGTQMIVTRACRPLGTEA